MVSRSFASLAPEKWVIFFPFLKKINVGIDETPYSPVSSWKIENNFVVEMIDLKKSMTNLIFVNIDFKYNQFALVLILEGLQQWGDHFARATPSSEKVNHDQLVASLLQLFLKVIL